MRQRPAWASYCAVFLLAAGLWPQVLLADSTWVGGNGSWGTASNWSPNGVPASGANIIISGSASSPSLSGVSSISSASLANGALLNIGNSGSLTLSGNLALSGGAQLLLGTPNPPQPYVTGGTVAFSAAVSQEISGSGQITFGPSLYNAINVSATSASSVLTLDSGVTIHGAGAGTINLSNTTSSPATVFVNYGTINSDGGGTITIAGSSNASWANRGTAEVTNGTLALTAPWDNSAGTLAAVGSTATLKLGGSFTLANLGTLANTGTVQIAGTFDLGGGTASFDGIAGNWALVNGGTLQNGTIGCATGALALNAGAVNNVRLTGEATAPGALQVSNGLVLDHATILAGTSYGASSNLTFSGGPQSLSGTGQILLASSNSEITLTGQSLTIGSGVLVHGTGRIYTSLSTTNGITNNGTITAEGTNSLRLTSGVSYAGVIVNNGTIQGTTTQLGIDVPTFTNNGLVQATGPLGSVEFGGDMAGLTNHGTIAALNGGVVGFQSTARPTFVNDGALTVDAASFVDINGCSMNFAPGSVVNLILGGPTSSHAMIHVSGGSLLDLTGGGTTLNVSFPSDYALPGPLQVIVGDNVLNGQTVAGQFSNVTPGVVLDYSHPNQIYITAIPEPSLAGAVLLVGGAAAALRRRRPRA